MKWKKTNLIDTIAQSANQVSHCSFFPKTTTQGWRPPLAMGFAILATRYLVIQEKKLSGIAALELLDLALMMYVRPASRKMKAVTERNKTKR